MGIFLFLKMQAYHDYIMFFVKSKVNEKLKINK